MEDRIVSKRRTLITGVLGGVIHFIVIGGFYVYLYGPELFGYSTATNSFGLVRSEPFLLFIIFGASVIGFVPAVLWVEWRLVTPTLAVVGVVLVWLLVFPMELERNWRAAGPPTFAFYFVFWFVPVSIAGLAGGIEYLARYLIRKENTTPHSQTE
jgi:hypothetical protein